MNIALITYQAQGSYYQATIKNEDDLLIDFLNSRGLSVKKAIWNDVNVNWENFQLAIIKSPWDYFDLIEDFYLWLDQMTARGIRLLNPVDILKWNADKHYLQDIQAAGLAVTPSIFLAKGSIPDLKPYFSQFKTETIIVKPVVSGGSKNTFKVTLENAGKIEQQLGTFLAKEDFIVQPFLAAIETSGEWSFVFFGGRFSHALLKRSKPGDFRVQAAFGGTVDLPNPSTALLASAQKYVDRFASQCLYARVDGTVVDEQFILMELELIEPFLFLETAPHSLTRYYEALQQVIHEIEQA